MTNAPAGYVYRAFDADGALLYVGMSLDAMRRLHDHRHSAPWWFDVATVRVERFANREAALIAERAAIGAEAPQHNIMANGRAALPPSSMDELEALSDPERAIVDAFALWREEHGTLSAELAAITAERAELIRQAATAGLTRRKIAEVAGISFQRVQQIVRSADG